MSTKCSIEREKRLKRFAKYSTFRNAQGFTDYRVAKEAGISQSALSDWKSGVSEPKIGRLYRIAKALNVSLDDFVLEEEK